MPTEAHLENARKRVVVALDVSVLGEARELVRELSPYVGGFKVGLEVLHAVGTGTVIRELKNEISDNGSQAILFADTKLTDISATMAGAARAVSSHRPHCFNVMASSGLDGMMAAVENAGDCEVGVVTVLTSLGEEECQLTLGASCRAKVLQYARNAKLAGAGFVICSPQELEMLNKHAELEGLEYWTPGVRPTWAAKNDQERVTTPGMAVRMGANRVIIGRPITDQPKEKFATRAEAAQAIVEEIAGVLEELEQTA